MTLKQILEMESIPSVYLYDTSKKLLGKFVSILHLCVCFDLLHFALCLTIYAVERNVVVYCHAYY